MGRSKLTVLLVVKVRVQLRSGVIKFGLKGAIVEVEVFLLDRRCSILCTSDIFHCLHNVAILDIHR